MNKVFVFGSLKKGFFNHVRLGLADGAKFISNGSIKGYVMYDLGYYPCIKKVKDTSKVVFGELYEYKNQKTEDFINRIESGAGYKAEYVVVNGLNAKVYIYTEPVSGAPLVKSGNWTKQI